MIAGMVIAVCNLLVISAESGVVHIEKIPAISITLVIAEGYINILSHGRIRGRREREEGYGCTEIILKLN